MAKTFLSSSNFNGSAGNHYFIALYYEILSSSSVRFYAHAGSHDGYSAGGSSSSVYINGSYVGSITSIPANSDFQVGYLDVSGSGTVTGTASCTTSWSNVGSASTSGNVQLGEFITSFIVSKRDESSVLYSYTVSSTADYAWYSIDDRNTWYPLSTGVVSGLIAGQTYNFWIKVRQQSTQATYEKSYQQTVYDYPKVTSVSNFTIGDGAVVYLDNPLNRNVTLQLLQVNTNADLGSYTGTYNGWINSDFKTTSAINKQYASIPNDTRGIYYAKVTYGSSVKTYGYGTYLIKGTEKPVITLTAEDTDKTLTGGIDPTAKVSDLTNDSNDKTIIKYISDISTTLTANAQNSSTIKSSYIKCGNTTKTVAQSLASITQAFTFQNVESASVTGNATDSRNLTVSPTPSVSGLTLVPYVLLTMDDLELYRDDETSNTLKCKGSGNYYSGAFGSAGVNNSITFEIRTKESTSETWGSWTTKTVVVGSNDDYSFDFTIGTSYDYTKTFNVQVRATDKCMTTGIIETVAKPGIPIQGLFEDFQEAFGTKTFEKDSNGVVSLNNSVLPVKEVVLYNDTTGGTSIQLNDSVANYTYIEIIYQETGANRIYSSGKLYNCNGKSVVLNYFEAPSSTSGHIYAFTAQYNISNNSISLGDNYGYGATDGNYSLAHSNRTKIIRVIGYK